MKRRSETVRALGKLKRFSLSFKVLARDKGSRHTKRTRLVFDFDGGQWSSISPTDKSRMHRLYINMHATLHSLFLNHIIDRCLAASSAKRDCKRVESCVSELII